MLVKIRILLSYRDYVKTFINLHHLKILIMGDFTKMIKNRLFIFGVLISIIVVNCTFNSNLFLTSIIPQKEDNLKRGLESSDGIKYNPNLAQISGNFSNYNLSVIMDEVNSLVKGNLSVDFYNNDNVNFTRIPFHIYLSGMYYYSRQGEIEIINVTNVISPHILFPFEVYPLSQIMWVNLSEPLEPQKRVQFMIQFNAILPDGGIDRANSYGSNSTQSRIYKFASFYPIPCVYDIEDGWNTDPYLITGDPFYFDMAYYNFFIEAPKGMVIAASGGLEEKIDRGPNIRYHFNPVHPVREVTFSASRYFKFRSKIVNGVNVSTYYLQNNASFWNPLAITHAEAALLLFNDSFGIYPYPSLNVVAEFTAYGGMEYPTQVYISVHISSWNFFEEAIVHEICHQWWYNLIGNDEVDLGFLDEGLTCWSTDYYGRVYYNNWLYFQYYQTNLDIVRLYYTREGFSSKINQTVYECLATDTDYVYVAYYKAPLILDKLRRTIGLTAFLEGLRLYYERHQYELVVLSDLQQAFEDVIGHSLGWFFFPWFDNLYLPRYSITHNTYDSDSQNLDITIIDLNEPWNDYDYSQQVPLEVYDTSNTLLFSQTVWINGTTELSLSMSTRPSRVSLLYNNFVLVQLDNEFDLTYDSSVENRGFFVPGYKISFLMIVSLILISIIISERQWKKRCN